MNLGPCSVTRQLQKGVWVAAKHRCWHVSYISGEAQLSWHIHEQGKEGRGGGGGGSTTVWHHWAKGSLPRSTIMCRGWPERDQRAMWTRHGSFMCESLIRSRKRVTKGFLWEQMTCVWVRYAGMRRGTWVEKRQLFQNGCMHLEVGATGTHVP